VITEVFRSNFGIYRAERVW